MVAISICIPINSARAFPLSTPVFEIFRFVVILLIMKYESDLTNINTCDSEASKSANLGLSEVDDTAIPLEWNK